MFLFELKSHVKSCIYNTYTLYKVYVLYTGIFRCIKKILS